MTSLQQLTTLIDNLEKCETNQRTAIAQNSLVAFIYSCAQSQLIQYMDLMIQKLTDFSFTHIFMNLFNDVEFINKYHKQLLKFFIEKLSINGNSLTQLNNNKKYVIVEFLFNCKIQSFSNKTFATMLIQKNCRKDLWFCHSFLWTVNQSLSQFDRQVLDELNINEVSLLTIRVVKNWFKLPVHVVDEALRFINIIMIPKLINSSQDIQQAKQIMTLLLNCVMSITQSQSYKIGNTYKFYSIYLKSYQKLNLQLKQQTLISIIFLSKIQIENIFPNLQNLPINCLQNEIQKLQQFSIQQSDNQMKDQSKSQIKQKQINKYHINRLIQSNHNINILKGLSSFISQLFLHLTKSNKIYQQLINKLTQNGTLKTFQKVFQLLSYCNDKQIFNNFILTYHKKSQLKNIINVQININHQKLMKYIVRNCPTPIFYINRSQQSEHVKQQNAQQKYVFNCLEEIVQKWINQGKISQILDLIKHKIQKQYDQAFNSRQFQSACNLLTILLKSVHKINSQTMQQNQQQNKIISKDQVIEWIKALLNLNESCLPINRKIIVSKTYQIISQVYDIILPGNQYLQQVIQTELIVKSYPQKKESLQKLIQFYEKYEDDIFEQGYKNKLQLKRFTQTINSLSEQNQQKIQNEENQNQQNVNLKNKNQSCQMTNTNFRKYKLLDRIYKKIQQKQLSLKDRIYLWKIIVRVYKMSSQQNEIIKIKDVKKLFSQRPDILFARHLLSQMTKQKDVKQTLQLQKSQLQKLGNIFKEYPYFYEDQLKAFNKLK